MADFMDTTSVIVNGKKRNPLTLINKMVASNTVDLITKKIGVTDHRAKYYMAAYVMARSNRMAVEMVCRRFNLPEPLIAEHMEVVDTIMSGTVE